MVGRIVGAIATAVAVVLLHTSPAAAKLPPFELEAVFSDSTITVTVTVPTWDGTDLGGPPVFDGLVAVYPVDALDDEGRPVLYSEARPVSLQRQSQGVYQGQIEITEPGRWAVVPFADIGHLEFGGYPPTVEVEVSDSAEPTVWLGGIGVVGAGAVLGVLLYRRRNRGDMTTASRSSDGAIDRV